MARFIYVNPTGYPIEQLPKEWHGIFPFTEAQAVAHRWRKVKSILFLTASVLVLAGCMTDKEAWLRGKDIEAKAAHPATYQPLVVNGPLELKEGASIVATTPSQPYVPTDIPNGAAIQAGVIRDITTTAGLAAVGIVGAANAGDSTKTTINTVPAEGGK